MYQNIFFDRRKRSMYIWDDSRGMFKFYYESYCYIADKNGKSCALDGTKVRRIENFNPKEIKNNKLDGKKVYESDIHPEIRTLIDLYHESDDVSTNHKVMIFDIEVSTDGGFPNIELADKEITAIAYNDTTTGKYHCLVLDKESRVKPQNNAKYVVKPFTSERTLLLTFIDEFRRIDPTIITGWNIDYFDVPYLCRRIEFVLGKSYVKKLSSVDLVEYNEKLELYKIAGVSALDYLEIYKRFITGERPSYSLDAISTTELGRGKVKYEGTLDDLYKTNIEKFIEYNIEDVVLVHELDKKMDFISLARSICHKGHVPYDSIYATSRYLDGAALTYMKRVGVVAPNKKERFYFELGVDAEVGDTKLKFIDNIPKEYSKVGTLKIYKTKTSSFTAKFTNYTENVVTLEEPLTQSVKRDYHIVLELIGAYVQEPKPGLYEWLYDLDLTSLYPSIILTLNISPETKRGRILNWNAHEFNQKVSKIYLVQIKSQKKKYTKDELDDFINNNRYSIASNGVFYSTDTPGFLPSILEKWFQERQEYKEIRDKHGHMGDDEKYKYYDTTQYTLKILLNSFYGVLALPSFRFHDIDNAEAVTTTGREIISFTRTAANHYYRSITHTNEDYVIYTDTDSIFVSALPILEHKYPTMNMGDTNNVITRILEVASEVQDYINNSYNVFADRMLFTKKHRLQIKQETVASAGFWVAKKRYAQWIVNREGVTVTKDNLDVKGMDTVRSDFPKSFRSFLENILKSILSKKGQSDIDNMISDFKNEISKTELKAKMFPTGVRNVSKHDSKSREKFQVYKGTPAHVKASLFYNDMLKYINNTHTEPIKNGRKILWTYLKSNPLHLESMALKGDDDPKEIIEFVEKHIDEEKAFESKLSNKLQDFYNARDWGSINSNQNLSKFFSY